MIIFRILWRIVSFPFRILPWWGTLGVLIGLAWYYQRYLIIAGTIVAFHPVPVPPIFMSDPETVAEARLQDLRHFRHVGLNDRSFTEESRTAYDAAVADLTANVETLSDAEFVLGLARAQATIDNAHSNTSITRLVQGFPRLPIRSAWFGEDLHILRALTGFEDLLGAQITHINDVDVQTAASAFRDIMGGNDANFRGANPLLLETPAFLEAVGITDSHIELSIRVVLPNGRSETRVLSPLAPDEGARRIYSEQLLQPWRSESANWIAFEPTDRRGELPLYLQNPDQGYWMTVEEESNAVYISLRMNYDDEDMEETISDFASRMQSELEEIQPSVIIVDQRFNGGGDFTRTAEFMSSLGALAGDGRVYMLTGGGTFSAGIVNLAFAEQAAPDRIFFVGEEIGDRLQFWAEGWFYDLPNSNFLARFSTGYYDLQNGCEGLFRCHWGSLHLMPVLVDDLDVDIAAPITFEDYAAGIDPAMRSLQWGETARHWAREAWDQL